MPNRPIKMKHSEMMTADLVCLGGAAATGAS
jgi:hypothetical protein